MASTDFIVRLHRSEPAAASRRLIGVYLDLAKARLSSLVLVTAAVGYVLAAEGPIAWGTLAWLLVGTALTAAAANGLNQYLEAPADRCMVRTQGRPLVAGRISPGHAWTVSMAWATAGVFILTAGVNTPTALLGAAAILIYVLGYTPLKQRNSACTLLGAVVGAIPPLMGAAAAGRLSLGAWLLAGILFAWQVPHSLALAWLYREDYARGGYRLLVREDQGGRWTFHVIVLYCLALLGASTALGMSGLAGPWYAAGSMVLGAGLLAVAVQLWRTGNDAWARRLFLGTVIYLPLLLGLLLADLRGN